MTNRVITRAGVVAVLSSLVAACGAPYGAKRYDPVSGTNGRWLYDGKVPPRCNMRDIRPRHFEGDGHRSDHSAHAHLGHGHKWSKRNFKGYPTKPPCYVRRASALPQISSEIATASTRNALSGDLS